MLFGMRTQIFWDGNKRTSTICANKINEFNILLTEYYNTNKDEKIIEFLYNKCIFGIDK